MTNYDDFDARNRQIADDLASDELDTDVPF